MRINVIISNALNGIQRVCTERVNAVSDLFQRSVENNQPSHDLDMLEDVVGLEEDPQVQQAASGVLFADKVLSLKQAFEERIADSTTESGLGDITQEAVRVFQKCKGSQVRDLFPLLDQFGFTPVQKRTLHAAITGATQDSSQVERLVELKVPFSDHAERYTLRFEDDKIKTSKAELYTYGDFFKNRLSSEMGAKLRTIVLKGLEKERDATLTERVADFLMMRSDVKKVLMPLEKETFEAIISFMQGKTQLNLDDLDTYETVKVISDYFQIKDLEEQFCKNIDEVIAFARNFKAQEIDLMKYEGALTDRHIDQILALPCLRKADNVIDLRALFPKLSILDESVWNAHADMAALGLKVDTVVEQRVVIKNLHDMFRRLKIEGGAGITLLTMPTGLTLNKLMEIVRYPLQGNPTACCIMWDRILNQYGDISIPKTYTIAVTNSVLDKSRNLSLQAQLKLVKKGGCAMPGFLDLMALNLLTYISSEDFKTRLYNFDTFSRAAEKINSRPLIVGWNRLPYLSLFDCRDDLGIIGVAAQRKL